MKKITIAALMVAGIFTASCNKESEPIENGSKVITFKVDDLQAVKTPMTRAALADENITSVEIYDGNTLIKSQANTDEDFGSPSLELKYGEHILYFVAHRSEGAACSEGVWSATKVRGTFMKKVSLTVNTTTAASQSVELDRKIYRLKFAIADKMPATAASAKVTVNTYYGAIKLSDYSGQNEESRVTTMDISSLQGKENTDISVYGFCPTDGVEYTSDITVAFYNADNTLIQTHSKTAVPLQTNYITTIKGTFFQTTPTWSISLSNEWSGEKEVTL